MEVPKAPLEEEKANGELRDLATKVLLTLVATPIPGKNVSAEWAGERAVAIASHFLEKIDEVD